MTLFIAYRTHPVTGNKQFYGGLGMWIALTSTRTTARLYTNSSLVREVIQYHSKRDPNWIYGWDTIHLAHLEN